MAIPGIHRFIDTNLIEAALIELEAEREQLKRRQSALRVKIHRMKKLVQDFNQMELELDQVDNHLEAE